MSDQQKKALIGSFGALVIIAVGVWVFWGAGWWDQRRQDQVLSDLTEVAESNTTTTVDSGDQDSNADETADDDTAASAGSTTTGATTAPAAPSTDGPDGPDDTETDIADTDTSTTAPAEPSADETGTTDADTTTTSAANDPTTTTTSGPTASTTTTAAAESGDPVVAQFEVVETIPHDTSAFTQGLEIADGRLFESTGLVGQSSIRELDLETGEVLRNTAVPTVFGEGLTIVGDTAIQITWQDGIAYRYDLDTFDVVDSYTYDGQGWGLCLASEGNGNLVMSDGSSTLAFRDPDTFALLGSVDVRFDGNPIENLNELECVGDTVWANIWLSSLVVEIDPSTGAVLTVLDIESLRPESTESNRSAVWNGLAWDPADGTMLVTGKLWPSIYRLNLS